MQVNNEDHRGVSAPTLDGLSVLVVEDNYPVANWLARMLRLLGCQPVGPVSTVEAGLGLLERDNGKLSAAMLDIDLQGRTVYPLARALVQARVPIVFATGYGVPAVAEEWRMFPMLEKPFQANDLERALMLAMIHPQRVPEPGETYDRTDAVQRAWETIREGRDAQAEFLIRTASTTEASRSRATRAIGR